MRRRRFAAACVSAAAVAGCGFAPRRPTALPFTAVQLTGFRARSPLADALRQAIAATSTTRVVDAGAPVALEALADERHRSVVASTAAGQVREVQLRARFEFRLRTAAGRELIAPARVEQSRDLSYSETLALGKADEEAELFRSMQSDIVAQVMRRLAAAPAP